nr:acyltransferase [Sphingobium subterraneum]
MTELDALRGLGAILVVNFHYSTRFHEMFPQAGHVPFHIFGGNYRVLLFFAISGFAIFFTMDGLKSAWDFVVGRFARLFPAYWAAMTLTLIAEYYGHVPALDISPLALAVNVTMLQAFFFLPAVDGAYWTLAVELGFYASMITLWRLNRLRHIERTLLVWLALKVLMFVWPDMPERAIMLLVLRYIPFFAIGMLSYRAWKGQRTWLQQAPYLAAVLATVALTDTPDLLIAAALLIFCFRLMIGGALRWLCWRPLLWVGGISYSLYLVHQHIGFIIMLNGDRLGIDPWISYVVAVATAFALGALINRTIEKPAARWVLARWKERQSGAPKLRAA